MKYNFDEIIPRENTDCLKYDALQNIFGTDDLLPMWIADMDFRTPDFIIESLRRRLNHEIIGYTFCSPKWKPAIQNWVLRRFSWRVNDDEIGFVGGVVPAISFAIQCFTKRGDKVLIQPPVYHPYHHIVKDLERELVYNPLVLADSNYSIDFDDFERKAQGCTLFLLCNPHNPGGRVWTREELAHIADICEKNGVIVVSDEIHCDMTLGNHKHTVYASVNKAAEQHSITLMAASKTFNIAGLKSSYHIIKNELLRKRYADFLHKGELDYAHLFATEAVAEAYDKGEEWLEQMLKYVEGNISFMDNFIKENMPRLGVINPQASYLVFIDARKLGLPQKELVRFFVEDAKVGLNDGATFGVEGIGFMRMNVACPRAILECALLRIKAAYDKCYF